MNSRHRAVVVLAGLAIATLYMGLVSVPSAQCPDGRAPCRDESGYLMCGDCGVPDSGSIDSLHLYSIMVVIPEEKPASAISGRTIAPLVLGALPEAMVEALVHGPGLTEGRTGMSPLLAEVRMLRQQVQDQWKWIVGTGPSDSVTKVTLKVTSGGKSVASLSGTSAIAEIPEFPSRFAVTTTKAATTVTWGFSSAVGMRIGTAPGKTGALQRGDALSITFPNGSPGGFSRLDLNRRGTGAISLADVKTTAIAAASAR
jgi:hypothetical protein